MAPSATNGHSNGTQLDWTTFSNVIDGKLVAPGKTRHSINPATGKANPEVPIATHDDIENAMAAATKGFKVWAATPYAERQTALLAYADALEAEKSGFVSMLTQEQGKPVRSSKSALYKDIDEERNG